ncbi:MAG: SH3 domain-containing protein [Lachnospiraceae bacterium]|nr:SH3 domain-containing protein [Lachnospiraceae bacterium]
MRKAYDWGKVRGMMLSVFAVAFMLFAVSFECFAAEGTITAPSAKIRESASTSSAHVGSALNGEKYTITGQESGADGYTWYKVTFEETKSGYIRADLISVAGEVPAVVEQPATYNPTVTVTELTPVTATVTGSSVRVRPDAAASGGVVTSVVRDTVITIDGMATGSDGKIWYRINCTVGGQAILGFVREDFVSLQGEVTPPSTEVIPADPVTPDTPQEVVPEEPVATPEPKAYDTVYEDDKWYLLNNESNEKYVIDDVFAAVNTNRDLAVKYEKTAKSQKGFIWTLSILLVLSLGAVAFLVWKLKDMLDEAYFKQVEKKTLRDRESAPKKVMHTVGQERGTGQQTRRPAQGQGQRTAQGQQQRNGQRPVGEGVRRPAGQTRPNGEAVRKPVNRQEGAPIANRPVQQRPEGEAVKKQTPAGQQPTQPVKQPQQSNAAPAKEQRPQQAPAKPQGFQPKNFMADDDEFEFEFLNWDGEEEE